MGFCSTTVDLGGDQSISTVHPDIIESHILTRLDGPTLAVAACASSELHALSTEENLWRLISTAMWPSIKNSSVSHVISTFPAGHRSFFSDSYPLLDHQPSKDNPPSSTSTMEKFISAVDIYYQDNVIYSTAQQTETVTGEFLYSPFRFDLLDPKHLIPTRIRHVGQDDTWIQHLEENLMLSWILIDPTRKRAVNVSSRRPVSLKRYWLRREVQLRFTTIMAGDHRQESLEEFVECGVFVTCVMNEGGEVHVSEVKMLVEDMEGRSLSGRDSLVIFKGAMEKGKRTKGGNWEEGKERYEEFLERKKQRKERMQRRARTIDKALKALDIACVAVSAATFIFWGVHIFL